MLDKISKDKDNKNTPDPRKNGKKSVSNILDISGRLKDMVGKVSGKSEDDNNNPKIKSYNKKDSSHKKIPRPMPKHRFINKPGLRPKKEGIFTGLANGFGKQLPEEDQRTLVGAAVFGIIIILLVGSGYYFFVFAPYQDTMNSAKMAKINEVNSYFKGPLATDPHKHLLLADIDIGVTPDQVLAVDVLGPATIAWREYQSHQINLKKDPYGRVMISYSTQQPSTGNTNTSTPTASNVKNLIVKVVDAQKIVNNTDASVLANMDIVTPDTVAVPIVILRTQAAGGLINVGNAVDIYQNVVQTSTNTTTQTTPIDNSPKISGATVLAILRNATSGIYSSNTANFTHSNAFQINNGGHSTSTSQSAQGDIEQLLRAGASRNWNEAQIAAILKAYGWRLSNFERISNLGELDAQYLLLLEVPRENALWLIQNSGSVVLTVPTQKAPEWMIKELHQIYG
ncbi:MAG: DUF515 domain-containing protein [Methanobacterium sp.]|nr:DUF515 domain-containing protein [Methanobacterium sp.]